MKQSLKKGLEFAVPGLFAVGTVTGIDMALDGGLNDKIILTQKAVQYFGEAGMGFMMYTYAYWSCSQIFRNYKSKINGGKLK